MTPTEIAGMVEQYRPFLRGMVGRAIRTLPPWISYDELYSAGLVGLWRAARRFAPERGIKFTTYAAHSVRWSIWEWLRKGDVVKRKARKSGVRPVIVSLSRSPPVPCRDRTAPEELLDHLCRGMSDRDCQMTRLRYLDGYRICEIAQQLGLNRRSVSGRFKHNILPHLHSQRLALR